MFKFASAHVSFRPLCDGQFFLVSPYLFVTRRFKSSTVRMFDRALTVVGANMNAVRWLNEPSHRADNDFSEVLSHVCSDDTSS